MYRTVFWTLCEKTRVLFERIALKRVLSYVKQISSPGLMHETGCPGLVHWEDPEGWDEEEGGRGDRVGEHMIHINVWQKTLQYCKVISLQVK